MNIRAFTKKNSSLLFTIGASAGVISTAYLSARGGYKAAQKLGEEDPWTDLRGQARQVWKLYIPAATSATLTVAFISGIKYVSGRETLAAQTALVVTQRAYEGYRQHVIEELGEKKDQTFLAKVAEKKVQENPPSPAVIIGVRKVLCCELFTGRYFESDMQVINTVVNEINAKLLRDDFASLDDFYFALGLEMTAVSSNTGWESPRLLELEFSTILHEGKPVLAFDYNYVKTI